MTPAINAWQARFEAWKATQDSHKVSLPEFLRNHPRPADPAARDAWAQAWQEQAAENRRIENELAQAFHQIDPFPSAVFFAPHLTE